MTMAPEQNGEDHAFCNSVRTVTVEQADNNVASMNKTRRDMAATSPMRELPRKTDTFSRLLFVTDIDRYAILPDCIAGAQPLAINSASIAKRRFIELALYAIEVRRRGPMRA
jgi:hypothetical protein